MRRLATLPARRLWAIAAAVVLVAAGGGIAQAALSTGGPTPDPKPLNAAVRDALNAPAVQGITARIHFTNHLLPSGSTGGRGGATPLLTGADGRLWLAQDGRARLELQSDNGDAQIVSDGKVVTVYDATSNTVYRATLPQDKPGTSGQADHGPATLDQVDKGLAKLTEAWRLSGAEPTSTAGQPSYTVKISPKDDGGLLGSAEVAWDAVHGLPLRAAVYAQGESAPVLELVATDISYGPVSDSELSAAPPAGAKVVEVKPPSHAAQDGSGAKQPDVTGAAAVAKQLDFTLTAPDSLAGLPRKDVRLVDFGDTKGALSTYGRGLGAIVVVQHKVDAGTKDQGAGAGPVKDLPKVNIGGATGTELATALGTVVTFERGGVSYTVAGSVPPVAAENAARGLR
jgi:outer membrane lipoprotein-sorting protein